VQQSSKIFFEKLWNSAVELSKNENENLDEKKEES